MIRTITISTDVPPSREVKITLPADVPVGPADLVVVVAAREIPTVHTLGELLNSEFFGLWRDRTDIADSAEFARRLRAAAWGRTP
ncbi:MAG: hypothetical protein NZM11_01675 [Anaerolineales bacterium]|nr:hypothetical protein [Anaerolineales bacterium]MDW8327635.1 hypothetical protein [Anaerolineales bacterium]